MKLKRLASQDFDRLALRTRLGDRARAMARAVLVDGRAQAEVAAENGVTKQRVNIAVAAIERAYLEAAAPGTGWINVELKLPEALALELANLMEAIEAASNQELRDKAVSSVLRALSSARHGLA